MKTSPIPGETFCTKRRALVENYRACAVRVTVYIVMRCWQKTGFNMSTLPRIRLLIADDHPVVLQGICSFLEANPRYEIVGKATNGQEVIDLFQELRPDIVITDLNMPGINGLKVILAIRQLDPLAKIIVLSSYDNEEIVYQALQQGAMSYILKEAVYDELTSTIDAVYVGEKRVNTAIATKLVERISKPSLSNRELEVLELMAQGKSNAEIAEHLTLSHGTVKLHIHNILTKMNVADRSAAISTAIMKGIIRFWS